MSPDAHARAVGADAEENDSLGDISQEQEEILSEQINYHQEMH